MLAKIALTGKKASATVFVSNLVVNHRTVLYMTAFGPTQEARAFAQLLMEGTAEAKICTEDGEEQTIFNLTGFNLRFVSELGNGYSGAFVIPHEDNHILVGETREECFSIFSRILDQGYFVHRDWYQVMFDKIAAEIPPLVGTKSCWRYQPAKIPEIIGEGLKWKAFEMPPATAHLTLEVKEETK